MKEIKKSVVIHAPASQVYAYLMQPTNLPEIWPSMLEVSGLKPSPVGGFTFDFVYKMAGVRFNGHSEMTKVVENKHIESETKTGIKSHLRWTFDGQDGATDLSLQLEYEVPASLLGRLAESFLLKTNEREIETMLHNLRERMESAGVGAQQPQAKNEKRI